jgi:hypothetical protein
MYFISNDKDMFLRLYGPENQAAIPFRERRKKYPFEAVRPKPVNPACKTYRFIRVTGCSSIPYARFAAGME